MTLDDFRILLGQPTLEATVTALVQYGYGTTILPFLDAFQRTHDIFPILHALDRRVLPLRPRGGPVLPGRRVGRPRA